MAGHSHSANVKYRKDRQDQVRSQLFLKLRKKLEGIVREERGISEKSLSVARENQFPKEKLYQIWEKIKNEKNSNAFTRNFYQAPFGILLYLEGNNDITSDYEKKLQLKKMPLASLSGYFQLTHSLKIELKEFNDNLEEYLITNLPSDIWEKVDYNEEKKELVSSGKEELERIKKVIEEKLLKLVTKEEKSW
jgi:transcriptional/translational regulatory protein YebC/TACO1